MNSIIFLMLDQNGKNGRDDTKWAEKPYFHCGPQAEKVIKTLSSTYEESRSYKDHDRSDKGKIAIIIKII